MNFNSVNQVKVSLFDIVVATRDDVIREKAIAAGQIIESAQNCPDYYVTRDIVACAIRLVFQIGVESDSRKVRALAMDVLEILNSW